MGLYLRAKFHVSSIILTKFRQGVILPPPPPQNEPLKNPPKLGLKLLAMLIHGLKMFLQDQAHQTYFESPQIHLLIIMYCIEHTNHDILLNFLFQKLCKLFLHARNLHQ